MGGKGSLSAGFSLVPKGLKNNEILMGQKMEVEATWIVSKLDDITFLFEECTVSQEASYVYLIKDGCYANKLEVQKHSTGREVQRQSFSYKTFMISNTVSRNQTLKCRIKLCHVGQCLTYTECPTEEQMLPYNFTA